MVTFIQFLEKQAGLYGINTGRSPGKMLSAVKPAKPAKPTFASFLTNKPK